MFLVPSWFIIVKLNSALNPKAVSMPEENLYIGLISGTSMDGVDAALVDFAEGCKVIQTLHRPYPDSIKEPLAALAEHPEGCHLDSIGVLDRELGGLFADTALALLRAASTPAERIATIGSHGQTLRHRPPTGPDDMLAYSLQIGDPNTIAERTGITTVGDFRRRDIAAGGHAAPLLPAFHAEVFARADAPVVVLNIGGIANITLIDPAGGIRGFDTGPGNGLMNQWMAQHFAEPFDRNGELARRGKDVAALLAQLLNDAYFKQPPPKSTGPEYFNLGWLESYIAGLELTPKDILRTLNTLTATSIARDIETHAANAAEVWVCGGGVHNSLLMEQLQAHLPGRSVRSTADYGLDPDFIEAAGFALLAKRTLERQPGNIPTVTGAKRPVVLGGIYRA